uniref:Cytochrome P450 n=1 Tax=Oryza brachyantha TaxID=4533 RepID=J3N2X1_ORYBR
MEEKLLLALAVSVLAVAVAVAVITKRVSWAARPKRNQPPGPWTLPVIGSIHHLVRSHSIQRSMRTLAEEHGPLMQIWLGEVPAVVVSSPEAAREGLRNHDLAFADRYVSTTIATIYLGGRDLAFAPYGERWRQLRKLCTQELLTAARVRSFRRVREEEVARLVRGLAASATAGDAVNLTEKIAQLVNDVVVRCCIGGRSKHRGEFLDALRAALSQVTWLTVADVFPSSKLARIVGTAPRKALACRKKIERILEQIIQERKQIKEESTSTGAPMAAGNECFLDVLLRLQEEGDTPIPITNETIMLLLHDMFSAGSETSSTTLIWTMAELIKSPRVMTKANLEVRQVFEGNKAITDDEIAKLSYLKMVIKESLRMHCPVPLLGPRKCVRHARLWAMAYPRALSCL